MDPFQAALNRDLHLQAVIGKGVDFSLSDRLIAHIFVVIIDLCRLRQLAVHNVFYGASLVNADDHPRVVQLGRLGDGSVGKSRRMAEQQAGRRGKEKAAHFLSCHCISAPLRSYYSLLIFQFFRHPTGIT